jgi:hypothetical protein
VKRPATALPALAVILALAILASGARSAASAQPGLQATLSPPVATVGDRIEVVLTVPASAQPIDQPRFPTWGKRWGEAEIVKVGPPVRENTASGAVYRQRLWVTSFKTGSFALPPVPIGILKSGGAQVLSTPPALAFEIRSVLPAQEKEPSPKPAAPLLPLPIGRAFWWTLGAMALACAALLWIDARRRKRRAAEAGKEPKPILSPFEELVQALGSVGDEASAVEVHTRISRALRRYLGRRLPFPALESTTSEIQRQLAARRMPAAVVGPTIELLRACDLVKFARRPVDDAETRRRHESARAIAEDFEGHFAPPAPAPREAA